jgi:hypothetical protein
VARLVGERAITLGRLSSRVYLLPASRSKNEPELNNHSPKSHLQPRYCSAEPIYPSTTLLQVTQLHHAVHSSRFRRRPCSLCRYAVPLISVSRVDTDHKLQQARRWSSHRLFLHRSPPQRLTLKAARSCSHATKRRFYSLPAYQHELTTT